MEAMDWMQIATEGAACFVGWLAAFGIYGMIRQGQRRQDWNDGWMAGWENGWRYGRLRIAKDAAERDGDGRIENGVKENGAADAASDEEEQA